MFCYKEEIYRKNEKFIGNKTNSNRFLNKESRGESPLRKFSNNQSFNNSIAQKANPNLANLNTTTSNSNSNIL